MSHRTAEDMNPDLIEDNGLICPTCGGTEIRGVYRETGICIIDKNGQYADGGGNDIPDRLEIIRYKCWNTGCHFESRKLDDFNPHKKVLRCPECSGDTIVTEEVESRWWRVDLNGDSTGMEYGDPSPVDNYQGGNKRYFCADCEAGADEIEYFVTTEA